MSILLPVLLSPDRNWNREFYQYKILEAPVAKISSSYFDVNNQPAEKTYLNVDALEGWSPVQNRSSCEPEKTG